MAHGYLTSTVKPVVVLSPASQASGAVNSAAVDMQGWDGVSFVAMIGVAGATVDMKLQESDDNSTFTDVTNGAITQVAAATVNKAEVLEIYRPTKRYVRVVLTDGSTGNFVAIMALLYSANGRAMPPALDTSIDQRVRVLEN